MEGQIIISFCHADQISVLLFLLIRQICQLKWLAMHYIDDAILIQSLEHHRERPVRPSAEQAVKAPLQHCRGQVTQPNVMTTQFLPYFPFFHSFHMILPDFLHFESVPAPRMTAGHEVHISGLGSICLFS
jgi:hypothetical protein